LAKGCWYGPPAGLDDWWALAFEAAATWAEVWVQRVDWPESWLGVRLSEGAIRAGDWVGLVGDAEWPARNRSEDRPLHAERIRCS
jgi:hypothetical protein